MLKIYSGKIQYASNGEEDEILSIDGRGYLSEIIKDHIEDYGRYLTVRYWVANENLEPEKMKMAFIRKAMGLEEVDYGICSSETTGYLWTTDDIVVGGHDIKRELESYLGKYLYMEIEFNKESEG